MQAINEEKDDGTGITNLCCRLKDLSEMVCRNVNQKSPGTHRSSERRF